MVERSRQGAVEVVRCADPLCHEQLDEVTDALEAAMAGGQPMAVFDLHQTPFVDSAGLNMLLDAQEAFEARGGALKLAGANDLCREILYVTGIGERFEIFADAKAAVGSFSR